MDEKILDRLNKDFRSQVKVIKSNKYYFSKDDIRHDLDKVVRIYHHVLELEADSKSEEAYKHSTLLTIRKYIREVSEEWKELLNL